MCLFVFFCCCCNGTDFISSIIYQFLFWTALTVVTALWLFCIDEGLSGLGFMHYTLLFVSSYIILSYLSRVGQRKSPFFPWEFSPFTSFWEIYKFFLCIGVEPLGCFLGCYSRYTSRKRQLLEQWDLHRNRVLETVNKLFSHLVLVCFHVGVTNSGTLF